jgi:competence protein ComEC
MSIRNSIPFWKSSPFIRLLVPLIGGIVLQQYLSFSIWLIVYAAGCFLISFLLFRFLPLAVHYKVQWLQGIGMNLLLLSFGLFITWQKDIRNHTNWFENSYQSGNELVVRIDEPMIEKQKSYKANASVLLLIDSNKAVDCCGKIILYLSKDTVSAQLKYGDELLMRKQVQPIVNTGAFDYVQYEAFQQTFHTVYLKNADWKLVGNDASWLHAFVFHSRQYILSVIQHFIANNENEQAIASALLIGYNSEVTADLKQAYSNTGVVYLIAVSGMSLGLIYLLLLWAKKRIPFIRKTNLLQSLLILCCLWFFALIIGAPAATLRSAVVLTCIITGKVLNKKATAYNSLAASAFILLCYDPYFLWNIGFQISYLAVISILVFRKPVYDLLYIKNKWLDKIWQMISVTLAVQVLTFPICIYYFHQFPVLFLITNLVAIPLATIILIAELFLVSFSWLSFVGTYMGKLISYLIELLNKFVVNVNSCSFATIENLTPSLFSIVLLYGVIISISTALLYRNKRATR